MLFRSADPQSDLATLIPEDRDVVFVRDEDNFEEAAMRMLKYNLTALPVVDETQTLVGITSINDLAVEFGIARRLS